jgi:hypothetical protein
MTPVGQLAANVQGKVELRRGGLGQ